MRHPILVLATFALLALVSSPSGARAQARVSIEELTIDGDPPPAEYRTLLVNGIRPSLEEIRDLYGRRLAERPGLHGDYRLRMWVSNREVVRITPESSIGDATLEEQTRTAIYRFHLPPEAPTGGTWVRFVVRFTAPAASTATPGSGTGTTGSGTTGSGTTGSGTTGSGTSGSGTTGSGTTGTTGSGTGSSGGGLVAVTPGATASSLRTPVIAISSIRGALAESALTSALPVPALTSCISTARGGILRMTVAISRRGRVTATPSAQTFRHEASIACIERAIESLTMSPDAGPTRARLVITIPPAP